MMRSVCIFFLVFYSFILSLPVIAATEQAPASDPEYRSMIEAMKKAHRGPFRRIRWFCENGEILEPKPYACSEKGGGVQHGEWSDDTKSLREAGYRIANVYADLNIDGLVQSSQLNHELVQMLIEQYLIIVDDGWILRKALYYRGAFQAEDERKGGRELLLSLLKNNDWLKANYAVIRAAASFISHGKETASVTAVRQISVNLANKDEQFETLRNKIHVKPELEDATAVLAYAENIEDEELKAEYIELAETIKDVYSLDISSSLTKLAKKLGTDSQLTELLNQTAEGLKADGSPANQLKLSAELLASIREHINDVSSRSRRLDLLDLSLTLETIHFSAAAQLNDSINSKSRKEQLDLLKDSLIAVYGAGLISARQRDALNNSFQNLNATSVSLADYKKQLDYLALAPSWGFQRLKFYFFEAMQRMTEIEPLSQLFIQDQLRGSPLFFYADLVDGLLRDANRVAGVKNELFGDDVGAGLRALNPGIARGTLRLAHSGEDFDTDAIYLLPETISELPPIAGILTEGEGNPLSHVQLLARNLGIPNVGVDNSLIEKLKPHEGKPIILAVSGAGSVRISLDNGEWDTLFGKEEEKSNEVLIKVDLEKLDLTARDFLTLSELRATDSGRTVGPKAAKLGELRHHYPEAVAEGLAIPFGLFRELLDQPFENSEQTVFEWMVDQYRHMESLQSDERKQFTDQFRQRLQDWIINADPGDDFRTRLRARMDEVFGADGSYGVFVRSDTNVEDLPGFTGAGLNLTVPNVVGVENILHAISRVWASPFSARAYAWRQSLMDKPEHVYPAVLLMLSVNADKSGVLVTQDIDSGDTNGLSVAVNEGVGGAVDGQSAESLRISTLTGKTKLMAQATATTRRAVDLNGGVSKLPVSDRDQVLEEAEISQLITLAKELPDRFPAIVDGKGNPAPADIEFGFLNGELKLFQIRPFLESDQARNNEYLKQLDKNLSRLDEISINLMEQPGGES